MSFAGAGAGGVDGDVGPESGLCGCLISRVAAAPPFFAFGETAAVVA